MEKKKLYGETLKEQYEASAKDLAAYYVESEQIPTAFQLGIDFDRFDKLAAGRLTTLLVLSGVEGGFKILDSIFKPVV